MTHWTRLCGATALAFLVGSWITYAQPKKSEETERKVKESEVPAAALAALKKAAGANKLNQIEEEIEHGCKFYEGQWTGPNGRIEVLVTETGDLVEIEELVPTDNVPAAVRASAERDAGKGAKLAFEKKTEISYEIHFKKEGKYREISYDPTGGRHHEEDKGENNDDHDED